MIFVLLVRYDRLTLMLVVYFVINDGCATLKSLVNC